MHVWPWVVSINDGNRVSIQEQGGVQLIKQVLQSHPNDKGVQEWANGALKRFK